MKFSRRIAIVLAVSLFLPGLPILHGQEMSSPDDIARLADYPLILDEELGVSTAQIGVGRLHQVDATLIEIPPGGQSPAHRHLAEEII